MLSSGLKCRKNTDSKNPNVIKIKNEIPLFIKLCGL